MKEEVLPTLSKTFALAALRIGVRVDGRPLDASRKLRIVLGPAHGQACVSLGATTAHAVASCAAVAPAPERPSEGTLSISASLAAPSSEAAALDQAVHGAHAASDPASRALRTDIDRFIRDSRAVDTEALCILAGRRVWAVDVSVAVVDAAGNAGDVAQIAAISALLHARRNDVSISGTDVRVHPFSEREPLPLPVHHVPVSVSYALFGAGDGFAGDVAALDPCLAEEVAADGRLVVCMNAHGDVCGMQKSGGLPVDAKLVARCAAVAQGRVVAVTKIIHEALAESSAKYHPMSAARPVLVAAEPVAEVLVKKIGKKDGDIVMEDDGGASMWNAVPMEEDAPPPVPMVLPSADEGKPVVDDDVAAAAFRSLEKGRRGGAPAAGKINGAAAPPAATAKMATGSGKAVGGKASENAVVHVISSDSSSSDDSDEDLMAAIIAKPKGGSARRAKKK